MGWVFIDSMTHRASVTLRCAQVREHGEDAPVPVLALWHIELRQDVPDVSLDRALAEVEALGAACVGEAFGHQLEDVASA